MDTLYLGKNKEVLVIAVYVITGIVVFLILVVLAGRPIFTVEQQTNAVIERFSKLQKIVRPGLQFKLPYFDSIAGRVSLRVQELDPIVKTKTKDNVFVDLKIAVQFMVAEADVKEAFYKLTNPGKQMESYMFDTIRAKVPMMTLDEVFEKKDEIAKEVQETLSTKMKEYGFTIHTALLTDIIPDEKVAAAMNEINTQQRLQAAANYKGEASKILVVKAAEADAEAKKQAGIGIANQRKEITKGWSEAIGNMVGGLKVNPEEVMSLMVMTQHYDVMSEMAKSGHDKVIFIPYTPGGVTDMKSQIMQALSVQPDSKS